MNMGNARGGGGIAVSDQVEFLMANLALDSKARSALNSLGPLEALALLKELSPSVRNPSAFITKAGNDRIKGGKDNSQHRAKKVQTIVDAPGIDDRAARVLNELSPEDAW